MNYIYKIVNMQSNHWLANVSSEYIEVKARYLFLRVGQFDKVNFN